MVDQGLAVAPPLTTAAALSLSAVTRWYGARRALGPLSLSLDAGAVAVVQGVNGAGKTTLLRVAAGLLAPTSGTRACPGRAVYLRPGAGARRALSVGQALRHAASLAGRSGEAVAQACRLAGLEALSSMPAGQLSAGQHARLSVALALVAAPTVACFDEPTAQVDDEGVHRVRGVVRELARGGCAVLIASHAPEHFDALADATVQLHAGTITGWL